MSQLLSGRILSNIKARLTYVKSYAKQEIKMNRKEKLDKILKALGSFIWLGNNVHNLFTEDFKEMFKASVEDAREAYQLVLEIQKEN